MTAVRSGKQTLARVSCSMRERSAAYSFAFSFPASMRQSETRRFKTALAMIFKLAEAAERSWRRLDGHNQLPKIILGVRFADGIEVVRLQTQAATAA
jgi:hypothetical protein